MNRAFTSVMNIIFALSTNQGEFGSLRAALKRSSRCKTDRPTCLVTLPWLAKRPMLPTFIDILPNSNIPKRRRCTIEAPNMFLSAASTVSLVAVSI